jgi:hypothetical protein
MIVGTKFQRSDELEDGDNRCVVQSTDFERFLVRSHGIVRVLHVALHVTHRDQGIGHFVMGRSQFGSANSQTLLVALDGKLLVVFFSMDNSDVLECF